MRISFDVSHVKQPRRNLYYTKCTLNFNNEERAIIRERALFEHALTFENGYVNYPPNAGGTLDPESTKIFLITLLVAGFLIGFWSPLLAVLSWVAAIALFVYSIQQRYVDSHAHNQSITLAELLEANSFTVCTFENPLNSKLLEHEIRAQADEINALLKFSAKPLSPTMYES
jgi:hypothetical protein